MAAKKPTGPVAKKSYSQRTEKGRTISTQTSSYPRSKTVNSTTTTPLGNGKSHVSASRRDTQGTQARRGGTVGGTQTSYSYVLTPKKPGPGRGKGPK